MTVADAAAGGRGVVVAAWRVDARQRGPLGERETRLGAAALRAASASAFFLASAFSLASARSFLACLAALAAAASRSACSW